MEAELVQSDSPSQTVLPEKFHPFIPVLLKAVILEPFSCDMTWLVSKQHFARSCQIEPSVFSHSNCSFSPNSSVDPRKAGSERGQVLMGCSEALGVD